MKRKILLSLVFAIVLICSFGFFACDSGTTPAEQGYTIKFDCGGKASVPDKKIRFSSEIGELPVLQIEGYTFNGWNVDGCVITETTEYLWQKDIIAVAQLNANKYNVTFDYENVSSGKRHEITVEYGERIQLTYKPDYAPWGSVFAGWFTEQDGQGTEITHDSVWTIAKDTTLYPKWENREATLHFDYQGAEGSVEEKTVYFNTPIGELPHPEKPNGNTFGGWFTKEGGEGTEFTDESQVQAVITILYAKWITTVYFDYDGATSGIGAESMEVVYNAKFETLPNPQKEGFSFNWWCYDSNRYFPSSQFQESGSVTLKADWIIGTDASNFVFHYWGYVDSNYIERDGISIVGVREEAKNLVDIVIPNQINGMDVLKIDYHAFEGCNKLERVTLPNTLMIIEAAAFSNINVSSIVIPESVTEIGEEAFYGCPLNEITIPENVTTIGQGAFGGCPLTEITIPFIGSALTSIEYQTENNFGYIFDEEYGNWQIPKTLTKVIVTRADGLKKNGFENCTTIKEIIINPDTKVIPERAFNNCGIVNFTIPDGITTIAQGAFRGCQYLEKLTVPLMGTYNANNHSYLNYLFGGTEYNSINYVPSQLKTVIVTGAATAVSSYAFYDCTNLQFVTIDHEITAIGKQAFKGCARLKVITLNSSAPTLGQDALTDASVDMLLHVLNENISDYQTKWGIDESRIYGRNKRCVLFNSRGGSAIEPLFVDNGKIITEPNAPRRSNYIFLGWYSDIQQKNKFDFNLPINEDIMLYAKWQDICIELDSEVKVDMNTYAGETYYFTFTPETSGYFTIRSYGTFATTGILYNSSGSKITSNSNGDSGTWPNFSIRDQLTAGKTYIIGVRLTSATEKGEFSIMITNG